VLLSPLDPLAQVGRHAAQTSRGRARICR
jgi:hypothetical protein